MRRRTTAVVLPLLAVLGLLLLAGCVGTGGGSTPDDPKLIRDELEDIRVETANTEELLKGSKAQLQVEDSQVLRDNIRSLEMNLIHLESRERALEERLQELAAEGKH